MKLKAILSDFDGTLVNKQNQYNSGVREIVSKLKKNNVHFSLATGRAYFGRAQDLLKDLDLSDYHIFCGGALILNNKTKKVLFKQAISEESTRKAYVYLKKTRLNFALETIDYSYVPKVIHFPTYSPLETMRPLSELQDFSSVLKILIFGGANNLSNEQIEHHKEKLSEHCKDLSLIKFKYVNNYGMDITSEKATKHTAVLEYEKLLNIPRDQIVGVGDSYNDYPLLTACGYKIAMGNAPDELKEIADFIAPSIEENGTVVALQHIINKFQI